MSSENLVDINDVLENLEKLETNLLELEIEASENRVDTTKIHTTFRYAHNSKSLLAMLNKNSCSKLMHAIESNFDLVRNGKKSVTSELIQKSLTALDCINENVHGPVENSTLIEEHFREVETIFTEKADVEVPRAIEFPISKDAELSLRKCMKQDLNIYQIEKLLTGSISKEYFNNLPIYETIKEIGNLIASYPDYDNIPKDASEYIVKIIFSSKLSQEDLFYSIFDPFKKIVPLFDTDTSVDKKSAIIDQKLIHQDKNILKTITIEDDFDSRQKILKSFFYFGECDIAVSYNEIISEFKKAIGSNAPYNYVYLGSNEKQEFIEIIKELRKIENENNIFGFLRCKIIISTRNESSQNIIDFYKNDCDLYVSKPIDSEELVKTIEKISDH